ncbi:hypothetical protein RCH11_003684 [Glaciihabitans sp. GrIS 2.15]|nr:hypothetical protein [Glaciihabitans sp. GrIS 2.15]
MMLRTVQNPASNNPQPTKIDPSAVELPLTISFTVGDWTQSRS